MENNLTTVERKRERIRNFILFMAAYIAFTLFYMYANGGWGLSFAYKILPFIACFILLKQDFGINLLKFKKSTVLKSILTGITIAILIAGCETFVNWLLFNVLNINGLRLVLGWREYTLELAVINILFQFCVGFSEEICYRFYFDEALRSFKLSGWLSAIILSLLFGAGHLILNGSIYNFAFAAIFSLIAFFIRYKVEKKLDIQSAFLTLSITHFVYDVYATMFMVIK